MKIAVMGAGALGCYFGGRLAAAGGDVSFIARGAHLEALQRDGLRVESPLGDFHLPDVRASDDPGAFGPVDLVLFLVKLYDTEAAAQAMMPMLGPETSVFSFQNGVNSSQRIGAIAGPERVVNGIALIPADVRSPGVISHNGPFARLVFGEKDGHESPRCKAFESALHEAGVDAAIVDDIQVKIWEKFIMLSALSAMTALTRLPIGKILEDAACAQLFRAAIDETSAVGRVICPDLTADASARALEFANRLPPGGRASMLDDLERGKRLELDDLSGEVVRLGAAHGVPTPTHKFVAQALSPFSRGAPL